IGRWASPTPSATPTIPTPPGRRARASSRASGLKGTPARRGRAPTARAPGIPPSIVRPPPPPPRPEGGRAPIPEHVTRRPAPGPPGPAAAGGGGEQPAPDRVPEPGRPVRPRRGQQPAPRLEVGRDPSRLVPLEPGDHGAVGHVEGRDCLVVGERQEGAGV